MSQATSRAAPADRSTDRYGPSQQARQSRATGLPKRFGRRMSGGRRAWYGVLIVLVRAFLGLIWSTCRVRTVLGDGHLARLRESGTPAVIVYWHQNHVFASQYLFRQIGNGLRLAFLTSPSVSGEVPAALIRRWGGRTVRGSSTRSAGETLRDLYDLVARQRWSLAITADGPKGPLHEFKPGAILLSKMSKAPIVPLTYAARRSIRWRSWDRFIVPMPFTTIVIAVGEPLRVPGDVSLTDPSPFCRELEGVLEALHRDAQAALDAPASSVSRLSG